MIPSSMGAALTEHFTNSSFKICRLTNVMLLENVSRRIRGSEIAKCSVALCIRARVNSRNSYNGYSIFDTDFKLLPRTVVYTY